MIIVTYHLLIQYWSLQLRLLQRMIGDAIEHIAMKDGHGIKCYGNDVTRGKNNLLPLNLWLQILYFARLLYVAITKHLQPHEKML
jgi:hypothetical protein